MKTTVALAIVLIVTVGCGRTASQTDEEAISQAVSATLAALPTSTPIVIQVTPAVEVEMTPTAAPIETPLLEDTPSPTLEQLVPQRRMYSHSYQIKEEFDRFKNTTEVSLLPDYGEMISAEQGALFVFYSYAEKTPRPPSVVGIGFWSVNDNWEYLRCHNLIFLVDGAPLAVETQHEGEVMSGNVSESVIGQIGIRDFLTLVGAQSIEGKLCNTEFKLTTEQREALRDVASRMKTDSPEEAALPTQPSPYDLALIQVDSRLTDNGFVVTGELANQGTTPVPEMMIEVTFEQQDTGAVTKQQQLVGPIAEGTAIEFTVTNPTLGHWNYAITLTTVDGEQLPYADLAQ